MKERILKSIKVLFLILILIFLILPISIASVCSYFILFIIDFYFSWVYLILWIITGKKFYFYLSKKCFILLTLDYIPKVDIDTL